MSTTIDRDFKLSLQALTATTINCFKLSYTFIWYISFSYDTTIKFTCILCISSYRYFTASHIIPDIYCNCMLLFIKRDIRSCICLSPRIMPDHFVKVTEALTINDRSQIKGNDHLLTLQPKKNTVLVSHGRPPWLGQFMILCKTSV
jgi:hypothetical protein